MKGYLLDTNICIFAFRGENGIIERIRQCGEANCYVSDITVMELKYGAYKSAKMQENLSIVNNFLKKVERDRRDRSLILFRGDQRPVPLISLYLFEQSFLQKPFVFS